MSFNVAVFGVQRYAVKGKPEFAIRNRRASCSGPPPFLPSVDPLADAVNEVARISEYKSTLQ